MKRMSIRYFDGSTATKSGSRVVLSEEPESRLHCADDGDPYFSRASSQEIRKLVEEEVEGGRTRWAQLTIEIDDIVLAFWLPAELKIYCDVFAMAPFPTAKTLLKGSPDSQELNSHWLSRLPKEAKSKKFRERFLRYVGSRPPELIEFQEFYGRGA